MLAGRVIDRRMFSLTLAELGTESTADDLLRSGSLPLVRAERVTASRIDLLEAYVSTYLTQEIRAEALVRSLESFTASPRWRPEYSGALNDLATAGAVTGCYGVYLGDIPLRDRAVHVLPLYSFLQELYAGRVLVPSRPRKPKSR